MRQKGRFGRGRGVKRVDRQPGDFCLPIWKWIFRIPNWSRPLDHSGRRTFFFFLTFCGLGKGRESERGLGRKVEGELRSGLKERESFCSSLVETGDFDTYIIQTNQQIHRCRFRKSEGSEAIGVPCFRGTGNNDASIVKSIVLEQDSKLINVPQHPSSILVHRPNPIAPTTTLNTHRRDFPSSSSSPTHSHQPAQIRQHQQSD